MPTVLVPEFFDAYSVFVPEISDAFTAHTSFLMPTVQSFLMPTVHVFVPEISYAYTEFSDAYTVCT